MNEYVYGASNEFTRDGVTFIAKDCPQGGGCEGCALLNLKCSPLPCVPALRKDKRNIVWVLKDKGGAPPATDVFLGEVLKRFDTLDLAQVVDEFGAQTLFDVIYLAEALTKPDDYIEVFSYSRILALLIDLPSRDKWLARVSIVNAKGVVIRKAPVLAEG